MAKRKPQCCQNCDFKTDQLTRMFDRVWICQICRDSIPNFYIIGSKEPSVEHPEAYVMRQNAYCTNLILAAIQERRVGRGLHKQRRQATI